MEYAVDKELERLVEVQAGEGWWQVPQGSLLWLVLFNIFINIDSGAKYTVRKFAGDVKMNDVVDTTEGRDSLGVLRVEKHNMSQ